jgi:hypothetical protein
MDGCFPIGFDVVLRSCSCLQFRGFSNDDDVMKCNDDTMICNDDDVITTSCLNTKLNLKRNRSTSPPMSEDSQVWSGLVLECGE